MVLSNFSISQAKAVGKAYTLADSDGLSLAFFPMATRAGTSATSG